MTTELLAELPLLLTRAEVAEILRCSVGTVGNLCRRGELGVTKVGTRHMVTRDALRRYIRGEPPEETDGLYPPTPSLFVT